MTYAQKLKDPRWKARRLQILKSENFQCRSCRSGRFLHVHHVDYRKGVDPWDYPDNMLICLCSKCHSAYEGSVLSELKFLVKHIPVKVLFSICMAISDAADDLRHSRRALTLRSIMDLAMKLEKKRLKE